MQNFMNHLIKKIRLKKDTLKHFKKIATNSERERERSGHTKATIWITKKTISNPEYWKYFKRKKNMGNKNDSSKMVSL